MKAVTEYTPAEYLSVQNTYDELIDAVGDYRLSQLFENFQKRCTGPKIEFSGYIQDKFVDALGRWPTGDEIIMLVMCGFDHMGAECKFESGAYFHGYIKLI